MGTQGPGKMFSESGNGQILYVDTGSGRVQAARQMNAREKLIAQAVSILFGVAVFFWCLLSLMKGPQIRNLNTAAVLTWDQLGTAERWLVFTHHFLLSSIPGMLAYCLVLVIVCGGISFRCSDFRSLSKALK